VKLHKKLSSINVDAPLGSAVIIAVIFMVLPWFVSLVYIGLIGLIAIILASLKWGLRGGLPAALWATLVMIIAFSLQGSMLINFIVSLAIYILIGSGLGASVDYFRKRTTELAQANKALNDILDNTLFGVAIIDKNRAIRWVNKVVCNLSGVENPQALIGKRCGEYLCPAEQHECPILDKGQKLDNSERILRRFDGQVIPILKSVTEINLKGEEVLLETFIDISDRKKAQDQINNQKERLVNIVEGANVGTWEWNAQTGETVFNEKWAEIIGYTLDELAPVSIKTWVDHTHPDELEASNRMLEKHFRGELGTYDIECRMRHKDGHWVWINDRGKVISWTEDGKPLWVFGTHVDITERKKAEEERQKTLNRLKALLENSPSLVIVFNGKGTYMEVSKSAAKIIGLPAEEICGKTFYDIMPRDVADDFMNTVNQLKTEHCAINKVDVLNIEGEDRVFESRLFPISIISSQTDLFGSIAIDITERKKAEEALRRQASERAAVDAFTNSVSHDLQAPLRRIKGFSEALMAECAGQLSDQASDYLRRINQQIDAMKDLTDGLLQLSLVVSQDLKIEEVNLTALALSHLEKLRRAEPLRLVETVVTPEMKAMGDSDLVSVALEKLLENAWKFTAGAEKAHIECGAIEEVGRTVYFIRDNGVGFDQQHSAELFTPFQKLHDEEDYPGIGIGLNMVYRIINRHGGEFWAEGEPGKGACFYFTLPSSALQSKKG
jgi:PAS domain S-box-containing protein